MRSLHKQLNNKVPSLDPSIVDEIEQWTPHRLLDEAPFRYDEVAIRVLANHKAVGPGDLPAQLLKVLTESIGHYRKIQRHHRRCVDGR